MSKKAEALPIVTESVVVGARFPSTTSATVCANEPTYTNSKHLHAHTQCQVMPMLGILAACLKLPDHRKRHRQASWYGKPLAGLWMCEMSQAQPSPEMMLMKAAHSANILMHARNRQENAKIRSCAFDAASVTTWKRA